MYAKPIIFSFLLIICACYSFVAYCNDETVTPDRCATPSSPERYCFDFTTRALKAEGDSVFIDFGSKLTEMLQNIAHDDKQQATWATHLAASIKVIAYQKRVNGLAVRVFSRKNIPVIVPMLEVAVDQLKPIARLKIDYEDDRSFTPDVLAQ